MSSNNVKTNVPFKTRIEILQNAFQKGDHKKVNETLSSTPSDEAPKLLEQVLLHNNCQLIADSVAYDRPVHYFKLLLESATSPWFISACSNKTDVVKKLLEHRHGKDDSVIRTGIIRRLNLDAFHLLLQYCSLYTDFAKMLDRDFTGGSNSNSNIIEMMAQIAPPARNTFQEEQALFCKATLLIAFYPSDKMVREANKEMDFGHERTNKFLATPNLWRKCRMFYREFHQGRFPPSARETQNTVESSSSSCSCVLQ